MAVYVALVAPVMMAPSLNHWLPDAALEVNTTEPPMQKLVADAAVMVGVVVVDLMNFSVSELAL